MNCRLFCIGVIVCIGMSLSGCMLLGLSVPLVLCRRL